MAAVGETGPMVGDEVGCDEVCAVFDPVVMVAPPGGSAMEPMVTRFS